MYVLLWILYYHTNVFLRHFLISPYAFSLSTWAHHHFTSASSRKMCQTTCTCDHMIESISAVDFSPSNRWFTLPTPCTLTHPWSEIDPGRVDMSERWPQAPSHAAGQAPGVFFFCLLLVELSILTWGNSLFDIKKVSHSFLWHLKFFLFLIWHPNYVLFPFWHHCQFCYLHRQIILSRTKLPSLLLPCPDPICGYDREQAAILQFRYST